MKPKIAFLGTGIMGAPMAANLLKAGFAVTAWNRTRAKAEALTASGANVAASPGEAVAGADVVVSMLENGPVAEAVIGEASAGANPGATFIDMSSIPPKTAQQIAAALKEKGMRFIDAPVSGGEVGAKAATLAIMAGGEKSIFEEVQPVLEAMGRPTYVGPTGSGQLAKLANQVIVAITIGAVAEALLLAAAGGADPAAVREALMGGFADSRILTLHGQRMISRNFVPGGASRNQLKDISTALGVADEAGLTLPLAEASCDLFRDLVNNGGAEWDHSALLVELERRNPCARVGQGEDKLPA